MSFGDLLKDAHKMLMTLKPELLYLILEYRIDSVSNGHNEDMSPKPSTVFLEQHVQKLYFM